MAFSDRRVILRAVLAATLVSAVGLAGCGRKGPLEPAPKADVTTGDQDASSPDDTKPNNRFPLDFLL